MSSFTPPVDEIKKRAENCIKFLNDSPDPYYCVATSSKILDDAAFIKISEGDSWQSLVQPGGKYYFTREMSSIVAFAVGPNFKPGNAFKILGAHTDSPNLRVKPHSKRNGSGLAQLNVATYGGGLWHTWFDRDLSISGKVIVRKEVDGKTKFSQQLVRLQKPILRIPNLCIHLQSASEREAFKVNKEDHLMPVLCTEATAALSKESPDTQQSELFRLIAAELECTPTDILDFDLSLYDVQPATCGGSTDEFLYSARLDNQASCFAGLDALVTHTDSEAFSNDTGISMVALFDHEEVGSTSYTGAGSTLMRDSVTRVSSALRPSGDATVPDDAELFKISLSKSLILSVDMAHAVHPNYASKHDKHLAPVMNGGMTVKHNVNQRYATTSSTAFIVGELSRRASVPLQQFAVRNDCPCGSTIGPMISENTGIRAVDIGMPQLSMHSIREMMGCTDLYYAHKLFTTFFDQFSDVNDNLV